MEHCERRSTRRFVVKIPLNFREHASSSESKHFGEIVNISPHGVCFSTSAAPAVGATLGVFLKIPKEVIGNPSPEWYWVGRVIYVRPSKRSEGNFEVGVLFLACELSKSAERRRNNATAGEVLDSSDQAPLGA